MHENQGNEDEAEQEYRLANVKEDEKFSKRFTRLGGLILAIGAAVLVIQLLGWLFVLPAGLARNSNAIALITIAIVTVEMGLEGIFRVYKRADLALSEFRKRSKQISQSLAEIEAKIDSGAKLAEIDAKIDSGAKQTNEQLSRMEKRLAALPDGADESPMDDIVAKSAEQGERWEQHSLESMHFDRYFDALRYDDALRYKILVQEAELLAMSPQAVAEFDGWRYKSLIQEAELLAMSPEAVAEFLKTRAEQSVYELHNDPVGRKAEEALRGRSSPSIDFALARYARFIGTLGLIFQSSQPGDALRLAVLSSTTTAEPLPVGLFDSREQAAAWLGEAPAEELQALFENPRIKGDFLRDLLERSEPWDAVPDERLATIVAILGRNERIWTPGGNFIDNFAEYTRLGFPSQKIAQIYDAVFNSGWKLAENVEPAERWAVALSYLYDRLEPYAYSIQEPMKLLSRWRPEASNALEAEMNADGFLSSYQSVRKGLAKLALRGNSSLLPELLASDDPGLRSAAYAHGQLTPEQLLAAYEREDKLVFDQAVRNRNPWLWRTAAGREALGKVAAGTCLRYLYGRWGECLGIYQKNLAITAKEHPDWFTE